MAHVNLELNNTPEDFLADAIIFSAGDLFRAMRTLHDHDYHGGYLCVADSQFGIPYLVLGLGQVMPEKWEKYLTLSMEKARRLAANSHHISSAQSRNDEADQWPGAIRIRKNNLIISFSGLPWQIDETYCLLLAHTLDLMNLQQGHAIAHISGNVKFAEAVQLLTIS